VSTVARVEVCIDCADPEALIPFWLAALGYIRDRDPRGIVDPAGEQPSVWFQRVPESKSVKNRLHLDLYLADQAAAEQRRDELVGLGATAVAEYVDFWLMADPAGNEFCLCWPLPPA
jgi:4a-hydroxytetrahydrobiopterin dehydratase